MTDPDDTDDAAEDVTEVTTCGEPNDRLLSGDIVSDLRTYEACQTITAESLEVDVNGDLTLRAGQTVVLGNGFFVKAGGSLTLTVDPSLDGGG